jgi:hypothetical protein
VHLARISLKAAGVNLHLPFVVSATNAVPILAALCGLVGLFLFVRGFLLLQRSGTKHATPRLESSPKPVAAVASRPAQISATSVRTEVIRLTADDAAATVTMSQQGKIAAALLKAGVPSPASWNTDPGASVEVASDAKSSPALQTSKLKVTQPETAPASGAMNKERRKPSSARQSKKNPAWLLWTGIGLIVLSVYVVAAHFGWL